MKCFLSGKYLIKSRIFNLSGKNNAKKNKGTNTVLLAITATETPIKKSKLHLLIFDKIII